MRLVTKSLCDYLLSRSAEIVRALAILSYPSPVWPLELLAGLVYNQRHYKNAFNVSSRLYLLNVYLMLNERVLASQTLVLFMEGWWEHALSACSHHPSMNKTSVCDASTRSLSIRYTFRRYRRDETLKAFL